MKEGRAVCQAPSHQRQASFVKIPSSRDHSSSGLFPKVVRTFSPSKQSDLVICVMTPSGRTDQHPKPEHGLSRPITQWPLL